MVHKNVKKVIEKNDKFLSKKKRKIFESIDYFNPTNRVKIRYKQRQAKSPYQYPLHSSILAYIDKNSNSTYSNKNSRQKRCNRINPIRETKLTIDDHFPKYKKLKCDSVKTKSKKQNNSLKQLSKPENLKNYQNDEDKNKTFARKTPDNSCLNEMNEVKIAQYCIVYPNDNINIGDGYKLIDQNVKKSIKSYHFMGNQLVEEMYFNLHRTLAFDSSLLKRKSYSFTDHHYSDERKSFNLLIKKSSDMEQKETIDNSIFKFSSLNQSNNASLSSPKNEFNRSNHNIIENTQDFSRKKRNKFLQAIKQVHNLMLNFVNKTKNKYKLQFC